MAEGKFQGNKTDGSLGNPYLIEDVQDLNAIRFYPTKNFKLAKTEDDTEPLVWHTIFPASPA